MRVLIADDDEDILFLVGSLLRKRGWTTTETTSGVQTLETLREQDAASYDVLVLDQNMPPGSGLEVIEWLRAQGRTTPAVLFTGYVSTLDQAAVAEAGAVLVDKVAIASLPDVLAGLVPGS